MKVLLLSGLFLSIVGALTQEISQDPISPENDVPQNPDLLESQYQMRKNDCPVNNEKYVQIEGKCYYIDADAKTIDAAYSACSSMSAKLWEPHTLDTMNKGHAHLRKVVSKKQTANAGIWVGISDEKTEGTWYYKSTGEIFPFKNHQAPWRSNEPDNWRNGGEDCAKMSYGNQMEMYDVTCTDGRLLYAICELDGYVAPVDCKWSQWNRWLACDKNGWQYRWRGYTKEKNGGKKCTGKPYSSQRCKKCDAKRNDLHCCTSSNPCSRGQGDCDSNSDCAGNLICGKDNCKNFDSAWSHSMFDCCTEG